MAVGQNQRNRKNDPMVSKTGKAKLGPLTVTQLSKLLESSTKPKEKAKIQRALNKRPPAPAAVETATEATAA